MSTYRAPLQDMQFVIENLVDFKSLTRLPAFVEVDADLVASILEEAEKLATEVIEPCNHAGDTQGARIEGDDVHAAPGFNEAYRQFVDGGWPALTFNPEFGGQGLPSVLSFAFDEMLNSANMSFALCPMLTQAAVEALEIHGTAELKDRYLERMTTGNWTGAMELTESQAGSNLAAIRSTAQPEGDHYRVSGTKIFITWGDHAMTDNIIHMVLARLPDAPEGVKGISLFLVPKYLVSEDGQPGERNGVKPISIEHKLGIHGSPTCVMEFDAAKGFLVGPLNEGLKCMFTMMNNARLKVGLEGVGISERAYQHAKHYAFDRVQGRPPGKDDNSPIAWHPDVRRMLMMQKSMAEAMRIMAYTAGAHTDFAKHSTDDDSRRYHQARVDLMVPLVKAWCTENCQEVASLGVQIHGGMGFVEETGAAQYYRDSKITTIYEGTTGIQAQDFAGRKIIRDNGKAMTELAAEIDNSISELHQVNMHHEAEKLADALKIMNKAVSWLLKNYSTDNRVPNAACFNLLMTCGTVVAGWGMAKAALIAHRKLADGADGKSFLDAKIKTARFFIDFVLPRALAYGESAQADCDTVMALSENQL